MCLPLITLAWPSVQRQFSRQKNFAETIQQRGKEEICAVRFFSCKFRERQYASACGLVFLMFLTLEFPSACSCHVCGFETEMNVQFVSHMSLHVDKEQWMFSICCTACDFVTMEEADMKAHVNSKHTGDDPCLPTAVIFPFLAF